VRAELRLAVQDGPVRTDPDGLKWTFLTKPAACQRRGVELAPARAGVRLAQRGGHVAVPTSPVPRPAAVGTAYRWIQPPAYPVVAVAAG
jgi:hypothetical protein